MPYRDTATRDVCRRGISYGTAAALRSVTSIPTWLDGMRRVPPDALVLRRVLGGQWTVADSGDIGRMWRLVSWWSPVTLALVIPSGGIPDADAPTEATDETLAARLARSQRVVGALRVLGALVIVGIVFGIPAAVARFGAWGFVAALAAVLLLAIAAAAVVVGAMRGAGRGWRRVASITAPLLWPFTAPRAAELVLERAVAGAAPLMIAQRLLGPARFAEWVRPRAYDALRDGVAPPDSTALLALVGRTDLTAIVHSAPAQCEAGERYCPRCARVYRASIASCAECRGLRLVGLPEGERESIQ